MEVMRKVMMSSGARRLLRTTSTVSCGRARQLSTKASRERCSPSGAPRRGRNRIKGSDDLILQEWGRSRAQRTQLCFAVELARPKVALFLFFAMSRYPRPIVQTSKGQNRTKCLSRDMRPHCLLRVISAGPAAFIVPCLSCGINTRIENTIRYPTSVQFSYNVALADRHTHCALLYKDRNSGHLRELRDVTSLPTRTVNSLISRLRTALHVRIYSQLFSHSELASWAGYIREIERLNSNEYPSE
jgi:hypothetical protein